MIFNKIIVDCDPGIDDAVALTMALFDPALDVAAVTAVAGTVLPEQATRNCQAIIEHLDPPRWPRIGAATMPEDGLAAVNTHLHGQDGLGNTNFPVIDLAHRHSSERVLCDEIRAAPDQVKIVTLGPLTNLARAMQREPSLITKINQLIILGGTLSEPGNITPAAEFNIYCDPQAARQVFRTPISKVLIPLDVVRQVTVGYEFLDQLPSESSRVGSFLRKILPFAFRSHRQVLGIEGIHLGAAVALASLIHPELFEVHRVAADVETQGELTIGMTVFDRRGVQEWRPNMHVATGVDANAVIDCVLRSLKHAGEAS
jgi:purine nucleosidase